MKMEGKRMNSFHYYVSQAFKSFWRNGLTSMTSVFIVSCCLVIFGLFMVITLNVNHITAEVEQKCEIQVFLDEETTDKELETVKNEILKIENVRTAELFTKEDTLEYMKEIFAENASALDGYEDDNPYRDSYKVTLKNLAFSAQTAEQLKVIDHVADVSNKREVLETILKTSFGIRNGSLVVMLLLCLISIFIIANTIKIAVFSRRKEIGVMKFVGATDWFIRWPFIFEGIITGVCGAFVSFGLVSWGYVVVYGKMSGLNLDVFSFVSYKDIWAVLLICVISIGTLIGAVGSGLSIRKHLDV